MMIWTHFSIIGSVSKEMNTITRVVSGVLKCFQTERIER